MGGGFQISGLNIHKEKYTQRTTKKNIHKGTQRKILKSIQRNILRERILRSGLEIRVKNRTLRSEIRPAQENIYTHIYISIYEFKFIESIHLEIRVKNHTLKSEIRPAQENIY